MASKGKGGASVLGSAQAVVTVDVSQAEKSVQQMQAIAKQLETAFNASADAVKASAAAIKSEFSTLPKVPSTPPAPTGQSPADKQAAQDKRNLNVMVNARKQALAEIANLNARIRGESQRFAAASAQAPSSIDRSDTRAKLAEARAEAAKLQQQVVQLNAAMQGLTPKEVRQLAPEFDKITQRANQAATRGINPLTNSINNFNQAVNRSRSGLSGYFTQVQQNLERLNQTSLAANLQEVSFRMLPVTMAAGATVGRGIERSQVLDEANLSLIAITGSQRKAIELQRMLNSEAQRYGLPMLEVQATMQRFIPIIEQSGAKIEDVMNIAARLMTLNPSQGFEGALFSITEAMASGEGGLDAISLRERFGIVPRQLREAREEAGSLIGGLDLVLNRMSRTTELAEQFGKSNRASMTRAKDAWDNLLATALKPAADTIAQAALAAAEFFAMLNQNHPVLAQIAGGFLAITAAAGAALIAIGQISIALATLKALAPQQVISGAVTAAANQAAQAAATSGGIIAGAGKLAGAGLTIAGGVAAGVGVASALGVGGTHDPNEQWTRLQQIAFVGLGAFLEMFFIGTETIGAALDLLSNTILMGVDSLKLGWANILETFGQFKIPGMRTTFVNEGFQEEANRLRTQVDDDRANKFIARDEKGAVIEAHYDTPTSRMLPGNDNYAWADEYFRNRYGEGNYEYVAGRGQVQQDAINAFETREGIDGIIERGLANAHNTLRDLFFPQQEPLPPPPEPVAPPPPSYTPKYATLDMDADTLEKAYELAVNNMIQTTRQLEDETLAASREIEDFNLNRKRAMEDFNRQMAQAEEDFNRSQLDAEKKHQEQATKDQEKYNKQRADQLEKYQLSEKRALEDHILAMTRMSRDVDQALSARNFLGAQNAVQRINDAEEDFAIERARKKEDFDAQQKELADNLEEQRKQREEAYNQQRKDAEANFQRQRQRQLEEFNIRLNREDYDRNLRLQREEYDRQVRNRRQQQDLDLQIWRLTNHNSSMSQIWKNGLDDLGTNTETFWRTLNLRYAQSLSNVGAGVGQGRGGDTRYGFVPAQYATGTDYVPQTGLALLHQGEIVINPQQSADIRAGKGVYGRGGTGNTISVNVDARGSNMSEGDIRRIAEKAIIPAIERSLREGAKERDGWR